MAEEWGKSPWDVTGQKPAGTVLYIWRRRWLIYNKYRNMAREVEQKKLELTK